jgi:hypothetical protein
MSIKASLAAEQKFSLVILVWTYAFLLRKDTHFSKHQKQHLQHINIYSKALFCLFNASWCLDKYSSRSLIPHTNARRKDPNATVPMWYLKNLVIEVEMGELTC